jgi:hypothetical protein
VTTLGGVLVGVCLAFVANASVGRRPGLTTAKVRPGCAVSILLIRASQEPSSQAIDAATGRRGFSHAAWDACESVDGVPVGIDCRPGHGVHRRPLAEITAGRQYARVVLPLDAGREAYGCARARVGQPYDGIALAMRTGSKRRGTICSELVWECLPESLRARVDMPRNRPVSPNDLARAFGVSAKTLKDVQVT